MIKKKQNLFRSKPWSPTVAAVILIHKVKRYWLKLLKKAKKKPKRFRTRTSDLDLGLITELSFSEIYITLFTNDVGLLIRIALDWTSIIFPVTAAIIRKSLKIFTVKQKNNNKKKQDSIRLLVLKKLFSITSSISPAMQDMKTFY